MRYSSVCMIIVHFLLTVSVSSRVQLFESGLALTNGLNFDRVYVIGFPWQARSQPGFFGKPEGPFCLSCTFIFRNERN